MRPFLNREDSTRVSVRFRPWRSSSHELGSVLLTPIASHVMLEFEIGLELDSAEVRGILLYNDEEWGR